ARREGNRRFALSPTGSTHRGLRCASPMTGPPPLGPGYMTGTKRHLVLGHGLAPVAPRYTNRRARLKFTGGRGPRAARGLYGLESQELPCSRRGLASISTVLSSVNNRDPDHENRITSCLLPNQDRGVGWSARPDATRYGL